jgi:hypothetical protein
MEPQLIHTYYERLKKDLTNVQSAANRFQALLDHVSDVLNVDSLQDLKHIAENGQRGLVDLLEKRISQPEIAGVKVNKRKAANMMELPDLEDLDRKASRASENLERIGYLKLDPDGQLVVLREGVEEELEKENSLYANTEEEQNLLEAMAKAAKSLSEVQQVSEELGVPLIQMLKHTSPKDAFVNFFKINGDAEFEINPTIFNDIKSGAAYHVPRRSWK